MNGMKIPMKKTASKAHWCADMPQNKDEMSSWRWTMRKKWTRPTRFAHTQTHLPCVSVDWENQPNFPFFFWVRSASVTPGCYQHAVHTARQQRQQWVNTQQNKKENVWQAAKQTTDSATVSRENLLFYTVDITEILWCNLHYQENCFTKSV